VYSAQQKKDEESYLNGSIVMVTV